MTKGSEMHPEEKLSMKTDIGRTLRDVLIQARDERRITCGLYDSGLILEMNPDGVMLCILPLNDTDDISLDIHYTLIEAFCLENTISLLKVDRVEKLKALLADRPKKDPVQYDSDTDNEQSPTHPPDDNFDTSADFNCVLVEYSREEPTEMEGTVLHYFKETCDQVPEPIIELAV